jgi:hypothetical protein
VSTIKIRPGMPVRSEGAIELRAWQTRGRGTEKSRGKAGRALDYRVRMSLGVG